MGIDRRAHCGDSITLVLAATRNFLSTQACASDGLADLCLVPGWHMPGPEFFELTIVTANRNT